MKTGEIDNAYLPMYTHITYFRFIYHQNVL